MTSPNGWTDPCANNKNFQKEFQNSARLSYKNGGPLGQVRREIDSARAAGRTDAADAATMIVLLAQMLLDDAHAPANVTCLIHPLIVGAWEALGSCPVGTARAMAIRTGLLEPDAQDVDSDMPAPSSEDLQLRRRATLGASAWRERDPRDEEPRWRISWHESAHAVALLARGRGDAIRWVAVHDCRTPEGEGGEVAYSSEVGTYVSRDVLIAGLAASVERYGSASGAISDLATLKNMGVLHGTVDVEDPLFVLHENAQIGALRCEVEHLIRTFATFQHTLADAVFVRGVVTGDEVRRAFARYQPRYSFSMRDFFGT